MKQLPNPENRGLLSRRMDAFLTRTLSSSEFTWREIMNLIVPGILDSVSIMFINVLITALISQNGENSVAAVSLVGPVTGLISCFFSGFSAGGTILVAQSLGKRDEAQLRCSIGMTVWLTIAIGAAFCLPFLLFPGKMIQILYPTAEAAVAEKARIYLSGCTWSILVFTVYTGIFAVLRGLGESKRCLVLTIIINVSYLVFSIFFLNLLKMDIEGSVCALILARALGAASAIAALLIYRPPVKIALRQIFTLDGGLLHRMLRVSIPLGAEQVFASLGNIVAQMYMITLGTSALAVHAIANSLVGILYAPAMSVASVAVAVVGRCYGAGKNDEAYGYSTRCNYLATILLALTALIFYPLLPVLLRQYNPTVEAAAMTTRLLLWTLPSVMLFWSYANVLPSSLRATGDNVFPSVLSLGVLWLINIGLGYTLAIVLRMGLPGVWIAMWTAWAIRAVCFQSRFHIRKRKALAAV